MCWPPLINDSETFSFSFFCFFLHQRHSFSGKGQKEEGTKLLQGLPSYRGLGVNVDPRGYVVRGFLPLVGSSMENLSKLKGFTTSASDYPMTSESRTQSTLPLGIRPRLDSGLEKGATGEHLVALLMPVGPDWAHPEAPINLRRNITGPVECGLARCPR